MHDRSQKEMLQQQFFLLQSIRNFFGQQEFFDVLTPPIVENPGYEAHIHPFQVARAINGEMLNSYLHTSPEYWMKWLLAQGFEKIFTMSYCFRDDIDSPIHRPQFIMLEWYRAYQHYSQIMQDCEDLVRYCCQYLQSKNVPLRFPHETVKYERRTVQEVILEHTNIDILQYLDAKDLKELLIKDFPQIPLPQQDLVWEDYYFLLFLNEVEPKLVSTPYLLLYEFPRDLCALSTLKEQDSRVCERFEIYMYGIEICNCFNELKDIQVQQQRFIDQTNMKQSLYGYRLPQPNLLYEALEKMPKAAGIALGVERLLMVLTGQEKAFLERG